MAYSSANCLFAGRSPRISWIDTMLFGFPGRRRLVPVPVPVPAPVPPPLERTESCALHVFRTWRPGRYHKLILCIVVSSESVDDDEAPESSDSPDWSSVA